MRKIEALALAKKYKQQLQDADVPFISILLFGSAARDEMHAQSDIDIAVIGRPFRGDRFREMSDIRRLRWPISYKIQPIWFYPEHLENKYSTLAQEIKKDGIAV